VRLKPGVIPAGRIYFCHHLTRDLVWRDEWRHHPNGVVGVIRAVIGATNPDALAAVFARMFGPDAVQHVPSGRSLAVGLSRIDIVSPGALRSEIGDAAPDANGRDQFMAALTLRTLSLETAAAVLKAGDTPARYDTDRIIIPASSAFGVALEFRA
jgi:hypothetical protein